VQQGALRQWNADAFPRQNAKKSKREGDVTRTPKATTSLCLFKKREQCIE
jgi:hypothetical protein